MVKPNGCYSGSKWAEWPLMKKALSFRRFGKKKRKIRLHITLDDFSETARWIFLGEEAALRKEGYPRTLAKALRNYIRFLLEVERINEDLYTKLKRVIVIKGTKPDLHVPSDDEIRQWRRKTSSMEERYKLVFELVLWSGVRISEAIKVIREFDEEKLHIEDSYAYYELVGQEQRKKLT